MLSNWWHAIVMSSCFSTPRIEVGSNQVKYNSAAFIVSSALFLAYFYGCLSQLRFPRLHESKKKNQGLKSEVEISKGLCSW